jgi:hypothetical protein
MHRSSGEGDGALKVMKRGRNVKEKEIGILKKIR